MDINKLTEKSREALQNAESLAAGLGHQEVDVEHLFMALMQQATSSYRACWSGLSTPAL